MAFFQNAVLNKYLKAQDAAVIQAAYAKFKAHFHNPVIQENIRNSKEEQYQGEFLIDLFVNVLGYTKNPQPDFNLTTEYKNVKDSKKADGAIILPSPPGRGAGGEGLVIAVIELKGTDTTDLGKIETQAFGYKNNQPQCVYIITSNFEKLRFYIDNAIEHIEFNLFTLTENDFQLLWLCLAYSNIEKGIPKKIKDESLGQEDIITKKLYNDYSLFKRELHQNLVALNPQHNPLELFNKSQKLLDRFLFLFFAEDRQLLPPNAVRNVMSEWKQLKELDEYKPLYEQFKKHFNYLNTGFKNNRYEIYAYGGGLFKADELLDSVKIDDDLLYRHTHKLSEYDFASEVDVNILGHIFENSLNELDEIKAQLAGEVIDKSKTKRKKDGVFYTPKYITKYIVENTVGKLSTEQKAELQLNEEEYTTDKKRQQKTRQALLDKLTAYRNWLLQLTICDPACGSGAFLNQALDFLINEHRYVDELQAKLFGDALVLSDMENSILENNLFGVDLNEESVEIAKLSLWLRTAQPNRKLNDLNNNIKCGNSLIDDPAVAGDKAFNWEKEFPQVFAKGGFDVVIGNPPYITFALGAKQSHDDEITNYLKIKYPLTSAYKVSSYLIFIEVGLKLLNSYGKLSYIIPNTYHTNYFFANFREQLIENYHIDEILDVRYKVFDDAEMGYTSIPTFSRNKRNELTRLARINQHDEFRFGQYFEMKSEEFKRFPDCKFLFQKELMAIWFKAQVNAIPLGDKTRFNFYNGTKTGNNSEFLTDVIVGDKSKPVLMGKDFYKYLIRPFEKYILFDKERLWSNTNDIHFTVPSKLLIRRTSDHLVVAQDLFQNYVLDTVHLLYSTTPNYLDSYLMALLNSRMFQLLYSLIVPEGGKAFAEVKIVNLKKLPVKNCDMQRQILIGDAAQSLQRLTTEYSLFCESLLKYIQSKFDIAYPSTKLQHWPSLDFKSFLAELKKAKVQLSLAEEAEWMSYFNTEKQKAQALKTQIAQTDKEIDRMVYELYGLTEEEIKIVEG